MPFRRKRHPMRALIEDRPLVLAFFVVLAVGVLAGFVSWSSTERRDKEAGDPVVEQLFASGKALETEYLSIAAVRDPGDDDLALLGKAIENQRNWMRAVGGNDPEQLARLREMENTFDTARARLLATRSRESEAAAQREVEAGRPVQALPFLQKALDAQRELNRGHPRAEHRDLARENSLAQEVEGLRVEPLAADLSAATTMAREAAAAGHSDAAVAAWRTAHDLQVKINREFPRVRYADLANLDRIDVEIDTLESVADEARITGLQSLAARASGADAANLWGEAAALQRKINTEKPRSRHFSADRLDMLEVERQTAAGGALASRIGALDKELTSLLAAGDVDGALPKIALGGTAIDELASRYPRSRQADPGLKLKFNYLTTVRDSIAKTVAEVRAGLAGVPGRPGVRMFKTEVPQELYSRIMRGNPSRVTGPGLPVDSVSWDDATEFCRRLGWILGKSVRLPTEDEFRVANGSNRSGTRDGVVWRPPLNDLRARRVSDGAPNENGFSDLVGNVAEWLDASGATVSDNAPVAGWSFSDVPEDTSALPVVMRARTDRSRTTGFRLVIEER